MLPLLFLFFAELESAVCPTSAIKPGGAQVKTQFFAVSVARAREAVADAMQASGVLLFKDQEYLVEGERANERVAALGLPRGDEAVVASIEAAVENGTPGACIRVETRRRGMKKGQPKRNWSEAVMDTTECLLKALSPDDPLHRSARLVVATTQVRVPAGTQFPVRLRRFHFNTDLRQGKLVLFESATDITQNGEVIVPRGSAVFARVHLERDIGEFGRAAHGRLSFEYMLLPDGTKLPVRTVVEQQGRRRVEPLNALRSGVIRIPDAGWLYGTGFCLPAGTTYHVEVAATDPDKVPCTWIRRIPR